MLKTYIYLDNNKKYSININVLFDVVIKLEEILKQLSVGTINETKNKITDIIIMMSHIIDENNKNLLEINSELKNLKKYPSTEHKHEIQLKDGIYTGPYIDNKKEGKGIYKYYKGEKYEGEYKNDLRNGIGIYHFKTGHIYNGEWENDKRHGKGILYCPNGEIYVGNFKNEKCEGLGIYYYYNEEIFIGSFKNNKREGYGINITKDNTVIFGKYSKNKVKKSLYANIW